MAVDSFARRLAAAAMQKGGSNVTKDYVDSELEKKYDKTGGAIAGDVAITGNLTVSGTTTTEKEKQLLVEDNVIVTNANKIDLKTLLSGLAINKNTKTISLRLRQEKDSLLLLEKILRILQMRI